MDFRKLGRTDLKVSRLALDTWNFGGLVDEADALRLIDRCLELGINYYDTSNVFGEGLAEEVLGRALRGRREQVVLATKVGFKASQDDAPLSRAAIGRAIESSLRRLGTDYLDLYYLQQPDPKTPVDETMSAVDKLVAEGKIRHAGVSNFASWQVVQLLWSSSQRGYPTISVSQPLYSIVVRDIEQDYLSCCKEFGIAVVAYNPFAGGLLSKTSLPMVRRPKRIAGDGLYLDGYAHPSLLAAVEKLSLIAEQAGISLDSLALRWLLSRSIVDSVLLSASSLHELETYISACQETSLPSDVLEACEQVHRGLDDPTLRQDALGA
jgi:aryl-alcohol dehydrogenase-like predicted oxidoreductase